MKPIHAERVKSFRETFASSVDDKSGAVYRVKLFVVYDRDWNLVKRWAVRALAFALRLLNDPD